MPELPEVETIANGLKRHIIGNTFTQIHVNCLKLRYPMPKNLNIKLSGQPITKITRRGKYLRLHVQNGCLLLHFGMSGKVLLATSGSVHAKHNHITFDFHNQQSLYYIDPRRFGLVAWSDDPTGSHPLLEKLGVEPLSTDFTSHHLYRYTQTRTTSIKSLIMNTQVVTGVGNIYATEALFVSGIHPLTPSKNLCLDDCATLVNTIQAILHKAIALGGTTLQDFAASDNTPGYFQQTLNAYGRTGQPCPLCDTTIQSIIIGQRTSAFCPECQPCPAISKV